MIKLSLAGESFKNILEKLLPLAEFDDRIYAESIQLCCVYIGMLVAKVVDEDKAGDVLTLIFEQIEYSEKEHRLNVDDFIAMINKHKPNQNLKP